MDIGGVGRNRFILQNAPHSTIGGSWTTTSMSGGEATAKLLMRVGDLGLELGAVSC